MPGRTAGGRDVLSRTLRAHRTATGLSGKDAAAAAGIDPPKLSRIELGRMVPTEADVTRLAQVYRLAPDEASRLTAMARDVRAENRRVVFNRDPAAIQNRIGRIERDSALIREFSPNVIPGLLQSTAYARALFASAGLSLAAIQDGVNARQRRQQLLDREDESRRWVVLTTEGALGWAAGPPELMIEQLERIAARTYSSNLRVGIVPFGQAAAVFPLHSWDLYDERAVIVGTTTATAVLTESRDVAAFVELTDALEALAAYGVGARRVLERTIDRYRQLIV